MDEVYKTNPVLKSINTLISDHRQLTHWMFLLRKMTIDLSTKYPPEKKKLYNNFLHYLKEMMLEING